MKVYSQDEGLLPGKWWAFQVREFPDFQGGAFFFQVRLLLVSGRVTAKASKFLPGSKKFKVVLQALFVRGLLLMLQKFCLRSPVEGLVVKISLSDSANGQPLNFWGLHI